MRLQIILRQRTQIAQNTMQSDKRGREKDFGLEHQVEMKSWWEMKGVIVGWFSCLLMYQALFFF